MKFTILAQFKNLLSVEIEKLNKKCEKYGLEKLSFSIIKSYNENNLEKLEIEISGCVPKIGKYNLVSIISKLADGTNLINNVPGEETPVRFRDSEFYCDHCQTSRYRKEVVIVRDGNDYKQLGKQCLVEYLGVDLENLVNQFSYINTLIENCNSEEYGPREEKVCTPEFFLQKSSVVIRKIGYISSKKAWDNPGLISTKQTTWSIAFPDSFCRKFIEENELFVEDQDRELVLKTIDWVLKLDGKNDFENNLKNIVRQEYITYKQAGYLASAIICYQKSVAIELEKTQTVKSEWVGEIKERITANVTCMFTKEIYNENDQYGNNLKTLVKFVTKSGENLTWFASGEVDYKMGEDYIIKATVKDHSEYQGIKQTVVNRVKIIAEKV